MVQSEGNYGKKYSKQPNAWPIPFWPVSLKRMSEVAKKSKQNRQKMWSGNFAKKNQTDTSKQVDDQKTSRMHLCICLCQL